MPIKELQKALDAGTVPKIENEQFIFLNKSKIDCSFAFTPHPQPLFRHPCFPTAAPESFLEIQKVHQRRFLFPVHYSKGSGSAPEQLFCSSALKMTINGKKRCTRENFLFQCTIPKVKIVHQRRFSFPVHYSKGSSSAPETIFIPNALSHRQPCRFTLYAHFFCSP